MACKNFKKWLTNPPHLLKLIVLLGCICASIQQSWKCFFKLSDPPISTHYRFILNDSIRYPAVTVCRRPSFKTQYFSKYGIRSTNLRSAYAFQRFYFDRYSIADFLEETTYNFSEMFGSYAFGGLGNQYAEIDVESIQTIDKGQCFILTSRVHSRTFGMSGGWFFYLRHTQRSRRTDSYGLSVNGYRVYLHDKREILSSSELEENSFVTYIYLESAELMQVHLDIKEYRKLPNICIEDTADNCYSKSRCLEMCFQKQLAEVGNCTLPWLYALNSTEYPQCSTFRDVRTLISGFTTYNRTRLLRNCDCQISCSVTMYGAAIVNRRPVEERNHPDCIITMHYASNLVSLMDETLGYDWNSFVADIGGSLGFLLGLSVVGFIGLLEKIIMCLIKLRFKAKQKTELDTESQPTEITSVTSSRMSTNKMFPDKTTIMEKKYSGGSVDENLYENLNDFGSRSFKYYETSKVGEIERF